MRIRKHPRQFARRLVAVLSTVVVAGSLFGCSPATSPDSETDSPATSPDSETVSTIRGTELTVWTFLNPDTGESGRDLALAANIEAFELEHGVDVIVEPQPWQELGRLYLAAFAVGDEPDVIMVNVANTAMLSNANALVDLNQVTSEEFRSEILTDVGQGMLNSQNIDGAQRTIPIWPNAGNTIFYRADVAGDTLPGDAYEFLFKVGGLTGDGGYGFGLRGVSATGSMFFDMHAGHGVDAWKRSFDSDGKFDFGSDEAVRTAEWLRALGASGALTPDATTTTDDDVQDQFASGRFAVAHAFSARYSSWPSIAAGYDPSYLRFTSYPTFDGNPAAPLQSGWTWGISANADNLAGAVTFLESMYSVEASMIWAEIGGQVPDRLSALEDPYFESEKGMVTKAFAELAASPGAVSMPPNLANTEEVFTVANELMHGLILTDRPVRDLLAEASQRAYGG